jgi:transcriptional regulator with XRE-family HTH domain
MIALFSTRFGFSRSVPDSGTLGLMKYPNRLKEMRVRAGLSQEQLATALGSGRSTITKYESGEREIPDLRKGRMAEILGCAAWELLAPELSPNEDEAALLRMYRELDPERRDRLSAYLRDLRLAQRS